MDRMCAKVMKLRACDGGMKSSAGWCQQKLPDEIIFKILSYLPLRSLYRFKCVCKLWNTLFLHPFFLYLHKRNSPFSAVLSKDAKILIRLDIASQDRWGYTTICRSSHDLVLQKKNYSQTLSYRIECSQLRDVLPIPNPQNPSLCIALEFVPFKSSNHICAPGGAVKLVSVHEDGKKPHPLCYEVLTLEIGHLNTACCWRAIASSKHSDTDGRKRKNIQIFFRMGVAYCIWFVETEDDNLVDDIEVDVLDMVNETYIGHTTFPRASFFSKLSMSATHLLDWNGHLSFAQLLKDELHVLVLKDHAKLKWAETKHIIKLQFLKPSADHKRITFHACADKSFLLFLWQDDKDTDKKSLCKYDIYTGQFWTSELLSTCSTMTDAELVALTVARIPFFKAGL